MAPWKDKKSSALLKPCIVNTPLVVNVNNVIQVNKGQGDGDTKWKGWAWKLLLVSLVIYNNKYIKLCVLIYLKLF